jgi:hypothetical protein
MFSVYPQHSTPYVTLQYFLNKVSCKVGKSVYFPPPPPQPPPPPNPLGLGLGIPLASIRIMTNTNTREVNISMCPDSVGPGEKSASSSAKLEPEFAKHRNQFRPSICRLAGRGVSNRARIVKLLRCPRIDTGPSG